MKKVVRCLSCSKVTRYYGSYSVELQERTKLFLTGETKEEIVKGKVCKECAENAGYKKREKKLK